MTTYINDFTGGLPGSNLTNANSSGGGTAFNETDTPQTTSGGGITYDTSHGLPALAFTSGATSGPQRRGWIVNPTNSTADQYVVFYFDRDDFVGSNFFPVRAMNADSSSQRMRVQITSIGFLEYRDAGNNTIWTSTQLASGVRYRVEIRYGGTTSSATQIKIFEDESTTPVQDSGLVTAVSFGGTTQSLWFGQTASSTNTSGKLSGRVGWSDTDWIGPYAAQAQAYLEVHLGTGIPSNTGVAVSQRWANSAGFNLRLRVSTSSDLSNPVYGPTSTVDSKRWVRLTASGLVPNSLYYGGVEVDGVLNAAGRFTFRTAPFDGDGVSHSILFGGTRQNNGGDEAFAAMKQLLDTSGSLEGRAVTLVDMGNNGTQDWGGAVTEDQVLDFYHSQAGYSSVPDTLLSVPSIFSLNSHDAGGDTSDKNGAWRTPVLAAYSRAVPHQAFTSATGAIYQYFDWGRVRYIIPDNWSERDPIAATDNASKRMWSQEQEDWFMGKVAEWPWAICVLGGITCRQDSSGAGWGNYTTQLNRIHNRLNSIDSLRRLVWLSSSRAALAADLGTSVGTRGVPQAVAGPFEQTSRDLPAGETWSDGYYNVTPNAAMSAFGEASFSDSGGSNITFTFVGRTADGVTRVQMSKNLDVTPRVLWVKPSRI